LEKILECINISASYGHIQVLWDINFSVNKDEITTIIGSNGAGKTTTFRTIAGLLPVSSGQIFFNNRDITNIPTNRRAEFGITLVPEGRGLFPYMTVYENLKIGAYTKRARDNMSETIKWVFEIFPILKEKKNQLTTTLSGGEQQMLAIGRGLMAMPELLIIDEMTLGLAPKGERSNTAIAPLKTTLPRTEILCKRNKVNMYAPRPNIPCTPRLTVPASNAIFIDCARTI
jgi:branched-chain amino acid transport system ATP-binding protein